MSFVTQSLASGHRNAFESIAAFSATDFREDLKKFDVPTLVIHGTEDQIVPFEVGGNLSHTLIKGAQFKAYEGAPHGLADTHKERLNNDLLEFLNTVS
ncbi:alpha/beta fold hydrolase [Arthrobacter sp. TMN-37]